MLLYKLSEESGLIGFLVPTTNYQLVYLYILTCDIMSLNDCITFGFNKYGNLLFPHY